jgi:hypothetical protein
MTKLIAVGILSGAMAVAGVTMSARAAHAYPTTICNTYQTTTYCHTPGYWQPPRGYGYQAPVYQPPVRTLCTSFSGGITLCQERP